MFEAYIELHSTALDLINQKFNLLSAINCRTISADFQVLSNALDQLSRERFAENDRILLVHMDTDYYDPLLPYGLLPINIIRIFKNKNIPLYLLLFVTNHIGIKKEFNDLLRDHHPLDRPTIVETLLSRQIVAETINNNDGFNFDKVEKAGLSMMGLQRSHRVALCNFLKDKQLLSNVALNTNFNQ